MNGLVFVRWNKKSPNKFSVKLSLSSDKRTVTLFKNNLDDFLRLRKTKHTKILLKSKENQEVTKCQQRNIPCRNCPLIALCPAARRVHSFLLSKRKMVYPPDEYGAELASLKAVLNACIHNCEVRSGQVRSGQVSTCNARQNNLRWGHTWQNEGEDKTTTTANGSNALFTTWQMDNISGKSAVLASSVDPRPSSVWHLF